MLLAKFAQKILKHLKLRFRTKKGLSYSYLRSPWRNRKSKGNLALITISMFSKGSQIRKPNRITGLKFKKRGLTWNKNFVALSNSPTQSISFSESYGFVSAILPRKTFFCNPNAVYLSCGALNNFSLRRRYNNGQISIFYMNYKGLILAIADIFITIASMRWDSLVLDCAPKREQFRDLAN